MGCGFDGSPESRAALEWAEKLARTSSATLRVIAVHEPVPHASVAKGGGFRMGSVNEVLRRRRREELDEAVAALDAGLDASAQLLEGAAADALARESSGLDLLVLGSRGYGPRRAVLLGSVSSRLVHTAQSPLVVVPRPAPEER